MQVTYLSTWLPAMYLLASHKKGISSCQLAKDLGVCQKTAWFMLHRLREGLRDKESFLLKNTVGVDELYYGTTLKNASNKKRTELKVNNSPFANKTMIVGFLERGGDLKLHVAGSDINKGKTSEIVYENVDTSASLMTDGDGTYVGIGKHYASHQSVNHSIREYVREGNIHTNTIEGAFGLFRRSIIGIYHKFSPKHLSRYCEEMQYRYNSRDIKDGQRFENALGRIEGTLSCKALTKDNGLTAETIIEPEIPPIRIGRQGMKSQVCQVLNGKVVAIYPSLVQAKKMTGIKKQNISRVIRGIKKSTGGYEWKYL